MSLKALDEALTKKLQGIYPNTVFSPLDRALEVSADKKANVTMDGTGTSYDSEPTSENELNGKVNGDSVIHIPYTYSGNDSRIYRLVVKFPLIAFDRLKKSL